MALYSPEIRLGRTTQVQSWHCCIFLNKPFHCLCKVITKILQTIMSRCFMLVFSWCYMLLLSHRYLWAGRCLNIKISSNFLCLFHVLMQNIMSTSLSGAQMTQRCLIFLRFQMSNRISQSGKKSTRSLFS